MGQIGDGGLQAAAVGAELFGIHGQAYGTDDGILPAVSTTGIQLMSVNLMLDSEEVYQMTKHKMDAAQISVAKRIHINLVLVKLLELHHLGYDLRHYHAQHHAFIKRLNLPEYFRFDAAG